MKQRPMRSAAGLATALALSTLLQGCVTTGGGPAGTSATATDNKPASSPTPGLQVGTKAIPLRNLAVDKQCKILVAPFDLSDNLNKLGGLVTSDAISSIPALLQSAVQSNGGKDLGKASRHRISADVREAIVMMDWLPMSAEVMYGQYLHDEMEDKVMKRDGRRAKPLYEKADALLAKVLSGIQDPYDYKFQIFIKTDRGENAMALPGGFVYIDEALVANPKLADKAYFALSHEISHVLQRHQTRAVQARIIDTISLASNVPEMLQRFKQTSGGNWKELIYTVVGGKLLFEQHFSNQELQADACAVAVLDNGLHDDRKLRETVQAFVVTLPRTPPPPPPKDRKDSTAASAQDQATAADSMVELVSRPIDIHPTPEARRKNLEIMLVEIRTRQATNRAVQQTVKAVTNNTLRPRPTAIESPRVPGLNAPPAPAPAQAKP
jgi:hypothetical protein